MLELDLCPDPILLIRHSLLDPIHNALLQILQLRLVVVPRLLQQLRE
jgi:hypothetical protein